MYMYMACLYGLLLNTGMDAQVHRESNDTPVQSCPAFFISFDPVARY